VAAAQPDLDLSASGDEDIELFEHAPCPVAIAPPGYAELARPMQRIGVGYDGSESSLRALSVARRMARRSGGTVTALGIICGELVPAGREVREEWPDLAPRLVRAERHRLAALVGGPVDAAYGDPGEELEAFSRGLDLLVLGTPASATANRAGGRTARYLAGRCHCPLLVLAADAVANAA
jgi:nucleotide-binding universal stress UspA family protein